MSESEATPISASATGGTSAERSGEDWLWSPALDVSPVGVVEARLDGLVVRTNLALRQLLGREINAGETSIYELIEPSGRSAVQELLAPLLEGEQVDVAMTCRVERPDGTLLWTDWSATRLANPSGTDDRLLLHCLDVTAQRFLQDEVTRLESTDRLTGLSDGRAFDEVLARRVARAGRESRPGALLVFSIDRLAAIREDFGEDAADELLVGLVELVRDRLRQDDVLSRLEDDEFGAILSAIEPKTTASIGEALLREARNRLCYSSAGRLQQISLSVGVAPFSGSAEGRVVLATARAARSLAASNGGNRLEFAGGEAIVSDEEREGSRLDEDNFLLLGQPIVNLDGEDGTHYELLLRMIGAGGTLVRPGSFLALAERRGLIGRIERWVVRQAVGLAVANERAVFHVNLSGRALGDPHMTAFLGRTIRSAGVDPGRLIFEVGEAAAAANLRFAREFSVYLSNLGAGFAIDHSGGGLNAIRYLDDLAFDYLKIDRRFVLGCRENFADRLVIEALTSIAHGLSKKTIANGIEDAATLEIVRSAGVDYGQGHAIGSPDRLETFDLRVPETEPVLR